MEISANCIRQRYCVWRQVRGKIIGVTNDFHFESMHQKIVPLLMRMPAFNRGGYGISFRKSQPAITSRQLVNKIQNTWYKYLPESPFTYTFLDESYARLYDAEQKQGTIFTIFACIAIFIACLGLLGLSAFPFPTHEGNWDKKSVGGEHK